MLRTLAKVPLRRCLHTSPPRSTAVGRSGRVAAVTAGSAVVATYLTWKTLHGDRIALDSVASSSKQVPLSAKSTDVPDTFADAHAPTTADSATLDESPVEPTASPFTATAEGEEEESAGGAYNPVTGEINWDCPCLGGMAYGPCGTQFREAFSCFVYSEKEPKGIDCVEKFKAMQNCFREHPDVYGEDIMDDDDDDEGVASPAADSPAGAQTTASTPQTTAESPSSPSISTA